MRVYRFEKWLNNIFIIEKPINSLVCSAIGDIVEIFEGKLLSSDYKG